MPVDAFPDVSPVMVPVFAEAHGMAPEEVERLITYPIESTMNGLPGVKQIKSTSAFGMAVIYVYFSDDTDIYFARQLVSERLASAMSKLPNMQEPPVLGPISTGLGQIFLYYLTLDKGTDTHGKDALSYLREINDWVVKYQLQTVSGVTDILSMGGNVLQYQILINPVSLQKYNLTIIDIIDTVNNNNKNIGGQFMVLSSEEHLVRGLGLLESLDDISNLPVKVVKGIPVKIEDVAEVKWGSEIRRGVVTRNGEKEVVSGIVMKLFGENTSLVIDRLYKKVKEVQKGLPKGIHLVPYYEQAKLVQNATWTVKEALIIGSILVLLTLAVFMGNLRSSLIVSFSLPFCALIAVICMRYWGLSANLMSLGGIAIAIGMLCDGAIVMVENIYRHLNIEKNSRRKRNEIILISAQEVVKPIISSLVIVIIVFLPIFTLEGIEGKMFAPMAFTISFALLGSLLFAVIIGPVLASLFLRKGKHNEFWLLRFMKFLYKPLLTIALKWKKTLILLSIIAFIWSMGILKNIGTEFIPTLEENSILIGVTMSPSIALKKGVETILKVERELIKNYPEIKEVISRIGRPEAGSHPHPVNYAEIQIELKPITTENNFRNRAQLVKVLNKDFSDWIGIQLNFTQPIQNAFDELLSGIKAQLAIKIFGENLDILKIKATEIYNAIKNIPGLVDLATEQSFGQPQIQVIANREACSRFGVSVSKILELVEMGIGGEVIGNIYLDTRRYGIKIRYQEKYRNSPEVLSDLLVSSADGTKIPLTQLATIKQVIGPLQINRENNQRRWIVQGNVRGRDLGSIFEEIKKNIEEKVKLPSGYFIEYGGQFENQKRAMTKLSIIVPVVIFIVFIILWMSFGTLRTAVVIIFNIPFGLIGGVLGLYIMKEYLSVPASVGFIALFGVALQDGMVLVSYFTQHRGNCLKELDSHLVEYALLRLRPVIITTVTTVLGLLPLLLSTGIGSEVQRPLAIVVVFGLISSTVLTLFVLPAVYSQMEHWFNPDLS